MNSDDKILIAKIEDKIRQCSENAMITNSVFLDMRERSVVASSRREYPDVNFVIDLIHTAKGVAVIMVSSELPEVLGMSNRIMVVHEGHITGIIDAAEADQEKVMTLATGGTL